MSSSCSLRSSPAHDLSSRTPARFLNGSSILRSSQEHTGSQNHQSSSDLSSAHLSRSHRYASPLARTEAPPPPRPSAEAREPEGHRSTRRLLSRLFSRRSSQDSSSGSSSVRSLDDDGPSTGGESVDGDEGARISCTEPVAAMGALRSRRADLAPIRENNHGGYRSGPAQSSTRPGREPVSSSNRNTRGGASSSSWLSSSLRGRCSPLLSRLRRHARADGAPPAADSEEGLSRLRHSLRRWEPLEHSTSQDTDNDDEDEEEEEEQEEGAVGLEAFGESRSCRHEEETLPELEDSSIEASPRHRVGVRENNPGSVGPLSGADLWTDEQREKSVSCRDKEKLRRIQER